MPWNGPGRSVRAPDEFAANHAIDHDKADARRLGIEKDGEGRTLATKVRTRMTRAIRFQNRALRFHLVDPVTSGDAQCIGDLGGTLDPYRTVFPGYQLEFRVTGGLFPMFVNGLSVAYPIAVVAGPDDGLWVMDQGNVASAKGSVVRLNPAAAAAGFSPIVYR